jgi:hypothetical protein
VISVVISATTCVASVVTHALCLSNGKNVIRILDLVSVLDSEHSGARISYYGLYKVFIVHLIYGIISLLAPSIMNVAIINTNTVYRLKILFYTTVYVICDAVLLLSDTQFIHFVLLLKYRFSVLNDTLINFTLQSLNKPSLNHIIKAPAVDRSVNSGTSAVSSSITLLKSTLRKVCRHHDSLCDISEFVNRTYSLQILLIVTVTCIKVLLVAHMVSAEFSYISALQFYSSKQIVSVSTTVWLFVMAAKFVQIIVVCNRASHEVSGL